MVGGSSSHANGLLGGPGERARRLGGGREFRECVHRGMGEVRLQIRSVILMMNRTVLAVWLWVSGGVWSVREEKLDRRGRKIGNIPTEVPEGVRFGMPGVLEKM